MILRYMHIWSMQEQVAMCKVTCDNFQIIGHEKIRYLLELKESILISTMRPKLNGNISSVSLCAKTVFAFFGITRKLPPADPLS